MPIRWTSYNLANINNMIQIQFIETIDYSAPNHSHNRNALYTRGWALDGVYNSRRPLDRVFALCDPVTYAKFGGFNFSRFGFITRTDRQTDRITHRRGWSLYSCEVLPSAWVINRSYLGVQTLLYTQCDICAAYKTDFHSGLFLSFSVRSLQS